MCTRIYHWHYLSPLVPSVLSRVGAEMGPTFWKLQKCAAFRQMHRYQLHFALVVAFSFCFENGAPAAKWKMGLLEAGVATTDTLRSWRARVLPVATLAPNARAFSNVQMQRWRAEEWCTCWHRR